MYAHRIVCFARALHGGYVIDQFVLDGTTRRGGVAAARARRRAPMAVHGVHGDRARTHHNDQRMQ